MAITLVDKMHYFASTFDLALNNLNMNNFKFALSLKP